MCIYRDSVTTLYGHCHTALLIGMCCLDSKPIDYNLDHTNLTKPLLYSHSITSHSLHLVSFLDTLLKMG